MAETRKIAAILAADVVGFSRMASADEDGTLARLRTLRSELIDPTVASQNGRVFKRTGDGALVEFRSVVEAVRCAITVQNAMIERNAGVPPDRRIDFVTIVTPNNSHFEPAQAFLEAGFHVVCDKPMTYTLAEAEELARLVET